MADRKQEWTKRSNQYDGTSRSRTVWRWLRPAVIFCISLAVVVGIAFAGYQIVLTKFILPIDPEDDMPVTIEVSSGSSTSTIANLLYDNETSRLIRNKAVFKIYVDFMGKGSSLKAGIYTFDRTMTVPEIVDMLVEGSNVQRVIIKFTLAEGLSVESMAEALLRQEALTSQTDVEHFLSLCKKGDTLTTLAVPHAQDRLYLYEGYLFPDTYQIYEGDSVENIINKLRTRLNDVMTAEFVERMNELKMTEDEVLTLASIIEKEAKTADFAKVSAVFHNRLKQGMPLQSDATIKYALGVSQIALTNSQLAVDSPYNTHTNKGLPIGPICNPGLNAIKAALWPDEQYAADGYLYFCLKEPESGELAFSKTLEEHNALVGQYYAQWEAYDAAQAAGTIGAGTQGTTGDTGADDVTGDTGNAQ